MPGRTGRTGPDPTVEGAAEADTSRPSRGHMLGAMKRWLYNAMNAPGWEARLLIACALALVVGGLGIAPAIGMGWTIAAIGAVTVIIGLIWLRKLRGRGTDA